MPVRAQGPTLLDCNYADTCFTAARGSALAGGCTQVPHRSTLYQHCPPVSISSSAATPSWPPAKMSPARAQATSPTGAEKPPPLLPLQLVRHAGRPFVVYPLADGTRPWRALSTLISWTVATVRLVGTITSVTVPAAVTTRTCKSTCKYATEASAAKILNKWEIWGVELPGQHEVDITRSNCDQGGKRLSIQPKRQPFSCREGDIDAGIHCSLAWLCFGCLTWGAN